MPRVASWRGSAAKSASAFHSRSRPETCRGFLRTLGIILKYILLDYTSVKYVQPARPRVRRRDELSGGEAPADEASGDEAEFPGPGDGFGAVGRTELAENMADVLLHGVEGDDELGGDALIRLAGRECLEHLELAVGQRLDDARCRRRAASPGIWPDGRGVECAVEPGQVADRDPALTPACPLGGDELPEQRRHRRAPPAADPDPAPRVRPRGQAR